jgi:Signal peptidase subunit
MNDPEEARIQLHSAPQKYRFTDITGSFRDFNATYLLRWNVVPWVGMMQWGKSKEGHISLPPKQRDS